jgi:hypothetical protein
MWCWFILFLTGVMASISVWSQESPYPADVLKVTILDKSGTLWKSFEKAPFPALKDVPFKEGKVLAYRKGRLPEINDLVNGRLSVVPWIKEEVSVRISVSRCDTLEPQSFKVEAAPVFVPGAQKPLAHFLSACLTADGEGAGEFFLPSGHYVLRSSDGRFLFLDDALAVPDREKKVTALLAHPVEVRSTDEKGSPTEGCRIVYSVKVNPYGRACPAFSKEGGWSGNPAHGILPVNGKLAVHAWCPGLLAFSKDFDLRNVGPILFLEGERAGTIEGEVRDEAGNPVKEYLIALYKKGGLFPLKTVRTDAQGLFRFENLRSGGYLITDKAGEDLDAQFQDMPSKIIPVAGPRDMRAGVTGAAFQMTAVPEPEGNEIEKTVELEKGRTVRLDFELGRERIWEGRVVDRSGRLLERTDISCDGIKTLSGKGGMFSLEFRKAQLVSCWFHKEGYRPVELKDVDPENAPAEITLSGTANFRAEIRYPSGASFASPPSIKFMKDGKPSPASLNMGIRMDKAGAVISVKAELEDGACVLSIRGAGFKPYTSKPFNLLAGQTYECGVVELEAGTPEPEAPAGTGSITVFLTDRAGNPVPDAPLAVLLIQYDRAETGMAVIQTDEGGMWVFDGCREFLRLYSDGPQGFLFAEGPALVPCNEQRICRFALHPPNSLAVTIHSLEPGAEAFEITVTTPLGIARLTVERGKAATFTNLASPADITIRVEGQEIFSTRMDVKDGENELNL